MLMKLKGQKMSKKYEYLISYAHDRGFGNAYITLEQKIEKKEQLLEIAEQITKDCDFSSQVVILNLILLCEVEANE